jgi:hypothetical protein
MKSRDPGHAEQDFLASADRMTRIMFAIMSPWSDINMRTTVITMATAAAMLFATPLAPVSALPTGPGPAPGIAAALAEASSVHEARRVCRHRHYSSRRLCWWRPSFRYRWWRWRR